jgi:NAD(P)-dependent dehydrogenase (short-subunit alcohol dehydrogenase family)
MFHMLEDRVIAIAGVGGGLGPVVAEQLTEAGATVAGTDRSQEHLDSLAADLGLPPERWDGRAVDLLDEEATREWCAALVERFGHVDALVHLVGGWRGGQPLHEAPLADWDLLYDLLVRTVQHTTRAFHDQLVANSGRFVLVSAKQAQSPSNTSAAYASAKAAAEAWTLALADGFEPGGATANIVVVEAILTPRMREESPEVERPTFTPAEDIAAGIAYLCSDEAKMMNGQRLALTMR